VTTTRRGWRAALDSSLLFAVVVCGSMAGLLAASPAASVVAGRGTVVASIGSSAAFVAPGPDRGMVDKGSPAPRVVATADGAVAQTPSTGWLSATSEGTPRDSAEGDDDDDNDDDDALEHALAPVPARGGATRHLTDIDLDPSLCLESDGHSLRAPPQ
jgi:hypothetical protein